MEEHHDHPLFFESRGYPLFHNSRSVGMHCRSSALGNFSAKWWRRRESIRPTVQIS